MIYPFWEVNIKRCMLKNFDVTIVIIAIIAVLSEKTTKRTTGSHPVIVCVEEEVMLRASGLLVDVLHFLFFPFRVKRSSLFLRGLSVPLETGEKTMRAREGGGGGGEARTLILRSRRHDWLPCEMRGSRWWLAKCRLVSQATQSCDSQKSVVFAGYPYGG